MPQFEAMRTNMVKGQIVPEGVSARTILEAFSAIPREKFVPHQRAHIAYMDAHFPLYKGRVLLRPATLARLLEECALHSSHKVLYIGCGTGYGPALLGHMGISGVALDCEEVFTQEAERLLHELGFLSLGIVLGPLEKGWEAKAPYDKIIIEGKIDFLPDELIDQLREGGELITFMERSGHQAEAIKYVKGKKNPEISLFGANAPHLQAFKKQKTFVFGGKKTQVVYGKN